MPFALSRQVAVGWSRLSHGFVRHAAECTDSIGPMLPAVFHNRFSEAGIRWRSDIGSDIEDSSILLRSDGSGRQSLVGRGWQAHQELVASRVHRIALTMDSH